MEIAGQLFLRFVGMQNETNHRYRFCCSLLTSQIRIRVGEYDFSSVQERLPYVERGVAKKVVHPKYNFFTYEYDLALVRLESSLTFAPHISPICLPATDDLLIGENATVTGWGRLSEGGTLPSVLQEVKLPENVLQCSSLPLSTLNILIFEYYQNARNDECQQLGHLLLADIPNPNIETFEK